MTHEEYQKAASYWLEKEEKKIDSAILKKKIDDYIYENNTCALATGTGDFVRCTPLEYTYHDSVF